MRLPDGRVLDRSSIPSAPTQDLIRLIRDGNPPDAALAIEAMRLLGERRAGEGFAVLVEMLREGGYYSSFAAAQALAELGDAGAVPDLERAYQASRDHCVNADFLSNYPKTRIKLMRTLL
jgi:HEAT repeat protein